MPDTSFCALTIRLHIVLPTRTGSVSPIPTSSTNEPQKRCSPAACLIISSHCHDVSGVLNIEFVHPGRAALVSTCLWFPRRASTVSYRAAYARMAEIVVGEKRRQHRISPLRLPVYGALRAVLSTSGKPPSSTRTQASLRLIL